MEPFSNFVHTSKDDGKIREETRLTEARAVLERHLKVANEDSVKFCKEEVQRLYQQGNIKAIHLAESPVQHYVFDLTRPEKNV